MGKIESFFIKKKTAKIRGKEVKLGKPSVEAETLELSDDCFTDGKLNEKGMRRVNETGHISLPNFRI